METHDINDAYGDDDEGPWPSLLVYFSMVFCNSCMQTKNKWNISTKNMDINKNKWKS